MAEVSNTDSCRPTVLFLVFLGILFSKYIEADLIIRPLIHIKAVVGESVTIPCRTDYSDRGVYWLFGDHEIYYGGRVAREFDALYKVENDGKGGFNLVIDSFDETYAGIYVCVDDDGAGPDKASTNLTLSPTSHAENQTSSSGSTLGIAIGVTIAGMFLIGLSLAVTVYLCRRFGKKEVRIEILTEVLQIEAANEGEQLLQEHNAEGPIPEIRDTQGIDLNVATADPLITELNRPLSSGVSYNRPIQEPKTLGIMNRKNNQPSADLNLTNASEVSPSTDTSWVSKQKAIHESQGKTSFKQKDKPTLPPASSLNQSEKRTSFELNAESGPSTVISEKLSKESEEKTISKQNVKPTVYRKPSSSQSENRTSSELNDENGPATVLPEPEELSNESEEKTIFEQKAETE